MKLTKIYFATHLDSALSDVHTHRIDRVKPFILASETFEEVQSAEDADVILIQEICSFKNFNYIEAIKNDAFVQQHYDKLFTFNVDDAAVGFFKGLYNNLSQRDYVKGKHFIVPPIDLINEFVFQADTNKVAHHLAAWRGNIRSNQLRKRLLRLFRNHTDIQIECSDSWFNHDESEKKHYIDFILNAKFSLCPAGWGPSSFRIFESMALGRCPVIIADQFIPCDGPAWKEFAIFIDEKDIDQLPVRLKLLEDKYLELGNKAKVNWDMYFKDEKRLQYCAQVFQTAVHTAERRSLKEDLLLWESYAFQYKQRWTFLQRVFNKIKRSLQSN